MRKQIGFVLLIGLVSFLAFADTQSKAKNKCYVSSSEGKDSNEGTIDSPLKTLQTALDFGADTILLRAGDVFYEKMTLDGKIVDKYGEGEKPILYGVKIPHKGAWESGTLKEGRWIRGKSTIWRLNLGLADEQYDGFKTGGPSLLNNAGAIVDLEKDNLNNCRKVPAYQDLSENFDFWQDCPTDNTGSAIPWDFNFLYLYFDGNPNDFDFGISMGTHAVSLRNGEIRNIQVKYWGFGIVFRDNVIISDCDIDGIGGHIILGDRKWGLLGNGLESWITPPIRQNCLIENCTISRTFDCGATIQGYNYKKSIKAENIIFRNNTFHNCCQSFEEFLRGPDEDDVYSNCVVENNLSVDAGINTGFRYYDGRYKKCHFLSNSVYRNTNLIIRNNIAINGNYYCAGSYDKRYQQIQWTGNTCYIKRGQDLLGNYNGTKDVIKVPLNKGSFRSLEEATDCAISTYRNLTGDDTTEFIIID